jgi:hypothetical protein
MYNYQSASVVTGCRFRGNVSQIRGGGMYNNAASPVVTNCVFAGNSAQYGGGLYMYAFTGISAAVLTNCTIANNTASQDGGGLFNGTNSSTTVANSIFWGDTVGTSPSEIVNLDSSASATVSDSLVSGGYPSGTNIIATDPLFLDATNGDLHLKLGSPAIDTANECANNVTLTDLEGNSRWDIALLPDAVHWLDMGALEYQGTTGVDTVVSAFNCQ